MLAAHRDQENLVHSHQVTSKQQHKTPGARFPKTPSRYPQHDENAPTAFTGKNGLGGTVKFGGDKTIGRGNGTRQALVTPIETRSRAPLGNKTTNAKARTGQAGGVKDIVKEFEKTQVKPTTTQRISHRSADVGPIEFRVGTKQKLQQDEEEEPEYAPPKPKDLPYESDVLPPGGLTFEGLKPQNLMKGYYQHFCNPVDENGVSKQDREFEETMKQVMVKAEKQNKQDIEELDWNIADLSSPEKASRVPRAPPIHEGQLTVRKIRRAPGKQPLALTSRRAASALSVHSDSTKSAERKVAAQASKARKPLTSLLQTKRAGKEMASKKTVSGARAVGEAASRTTIGYSRGRSASSMLHTSRPGFHEAALTQRSVTSTASIESGMSDLTITPARLRQAAAKQESRPQFMSIFDGEDADDEGLPIISNPLQFSEDEEDFEMKFDI